MDEIGSNSEQFFNIHASVVKMPEKEVTEIDRRKAFILLSVAALIAIVTSAALAAYAADDGEDVANGFAGRFNGRMLMGRCGWGRGWGRGGFIEVSEEYEANAIAIANEDGDVQELLSQGCTVAGVRPIIKTIVDGNGDVTTKATDAIVMLGSEDATTRASVWVDLEEGKVTQIVILTRTVIEKP